MRKVSKLWWFLVDSLVRRPLASAFWLVLAAAVVVLETIGVILEWFGIWNSVLLTGAILLVVLLIRDLGGQRGRERLTDFMFKLYQATEERTARCVEKARHTYMIERDGSDHTIRRWEIIPEEHALFWKKVRFGVRGEAREQESLDDLSPSCTVTDGEVWCVPVDEANKKQIEAVLFFVPPLPQGVLRTVTLKHDWPGTWDPLRGEGRDTGDLEIAFDEAEELVLEFIFPRGYRNPRFASRNPQIGAVATFETAETRIGLRWSLERPPRGRLTYAIEVDR